MAKPKVWVFQEGKNDYSPAEEFGDVQFVTTSDYTKFEDSEQNKQVNHDFRRFASVYIPAFDFIVPAGNPMLVALYTQSLQAYTVSASHWYLKWDGRRACYIPFKILTISRAAK